MNVVFYLRWHQLPLDGPETPDASVRDNRVHVGPTGGCWELQVPGDQRGGNCIPGDESRCPG